VDAVRRHSFVDGFVFGAKDLSRFVEKDAAVIGQGDVDIPAVLEQGGNQRRGNIREPAGLGLEAVGHPAHAFRKISDFRRNDEHAGSFSAAREFHFMSLSPFVRIRPR
jgi:hypothetical protein